MELIQSEEKMKEYKTEIQK